MESLELNLFAENAKIAKNASIGRAKMKNICQKLILNRTLRGLRYHNILLRNELKDILTIFNEYKCLQNYDVYKHLLRSHINDVSQVHLEKLSKEKFQNPW